jgi:hypothetical protein
LERRLYGPRADLDYVEKRKFFTPPGLELLPLGRPARGQSLYRLRYPGSYWIRELRKSQFAVFNMKNRVAGRFIWRTRTGREDGPN